MLEAPQKRKTLFSTIAPSLIVVLLIIGVAFFVVSASREARDSKRISDVSELRNALQIYFSAHGFYPMELSDLIPEKAISRIPKDPSGSVYQYRAIGIVGTECRGYHLGASLESKNKILTKDADLAGVDFVCVKEATQSDKLQDFSGSDEAPCSPSDKGLFCYDIQVI